MAEKGHQLLAVLWVLKWSRFHFSPPDGYAPSEATNASPLLHLGSLKGQRLRQRGQTPSMSPCNRTPSSRSIPCSNGAGKLSNRSAAKSKSRPRSCRLRFPGLVRPACSSKHGPWLRPSNPPWRSGLQRPLPRPAPRSIERSARPRQGLILCSHDCISSRFLAYRLILFLLVMVL